MFKKLCQKSIHGFNQTAWPILQISIHKKGTMFYFHQDSTKRLFCLFSCKGVGQSFVYARLYLPNVNATCICKKLSFWQVSNC